ncbi:MAG: tRNA (adenosine(37)-N6)-threonylcarbamoyltransferase complex dimerization subunit type 1 TsaB [Saprospiraceae bacterium]
MARILLIETATDVCSTAIAVDGTVVALAEALDQPNHAATLTLLIEACTRQAGIPLANLDAVAVSRGPGSYTSLRVGAAVAKGICYALDKPLIAVDTLLALASASMRDQGTGRTSDGPGVNNPLFYMPMLDARRKEVWTAVFDHSLREVMPAQPLILEHDLFQYFLQNAPGVKPTGLLVLSGNGAKKISNGPVFENAVFSEPQVCSASHLAIIAEVCFQNVDFQDTAYFEPFYMKPPNITISKKMTMG